jgi:homoserine kinase
LIDGIEDVRNITEHDTGGILLISGSGPSCLLISAKALSEDAQKRIKELAQGWNIKQLHIAQNGLLADGKPL